MTPKHTPGPWQVNGQQFPTVWTESSERTRGKGMQIIANCNTQNDDGCDLANARLIASAPELLEALKTLCSDEGQFDSNQNEDSGEWFCRYCNAKTTDIIDKHSKCQNPKCGMVMGRKAIAKAEGHQ